MRDLSLLLVSTVQGSANQPLTALYEIGHFCASYHTISHSYNHLRSELVAILDKLDATQDPFAVHDDRINEFMDEVELGLDLDLPAATENQSTQIDLSPPAECIEHQEEEEQVEVPVLVHEETALQVPQEEESIQELPVIVEPALPVTATESTSHHQIDRTAREEETSAVEAELPASDSALSLALQKAKTLLSIPLALSDHKLVEDLQTLVHVFRGTKAKDRKKTMVKIMKSVETRIKELEEALPVVELLRLYQERIRLIEEMIPMVFARVIRTKLVSDEDFNTIKRSIRELEIVMQGMIAHFPHFERLNLDSEAVTDQTRKLLMQIFHLDAFEKDNMSSSLFAPFTALTLGTTDLMQSVNTLEVELFEGPLTLPVWEDVDLCPQRFRSLEKDLEDWLKLADAHIATNILLDPNAPLRRIRALVSIKLTAVRHYAQTIQGIHGSYVYWIKAVINTGLQISEHGENKVKPADRSTLTVLKYKLISAYVMILNHPEQPTAAQMDRYRPAVEGAALAIDALTTVGLDRITDEMGHRIRTSLDSIIDSKTAEALLTDPTTNMREKLADFQVIWKKMQLFAFYACSGSPAERKLFLAKLDQAKNNYQKARQLLSNTTLLSTQV